MATIDQIYDIVKDRTWQGKIPWERTARADTFSAVFGGQSITLRRDSSSALIGGTPRLLFRVLDATGSVLDRVVIKLNDSEEAMAFFDLVKRYALQIDEQLETLLKNLETEQ
jgi:hypothetical protein